jgi:uncharacterized delta-60 repeat protein
MHLSKHIISFVFFLSTLSLGGGFPGGGVDPDQFIDHLGIYTGPREDFNTGKITTTFGSGDEGARGAILQANGKITAAGMHNLDNGVNREFAIVRFIVTGNLDTTFNTIGKALHSFGGSATDDWGHAVAIQTDGGLVMVGRSDAAGDPDFAILRLTTSGALDTTFNTTGKVTYQFTASQMEIARTVTVDLQGRVIVGGYGNSGTRFQAAILRLNTNATLDTTFKTIGKGLVALGSSDDSFLALTLQTNGHLLAGGVTYNGSDFEMAVARFLTDGALDTTFSTVGSSIQSFGSGRNDWLFGVALQSNGRIIAAGSSLSGTDADFTILRMSTDGTLDTTFNTVGKHRASVLTGSEAFHATQIQTNGNIIGAGYAWDGSKDSFGVCRFNTDGSLDTSFFTNGKSTLAVGAAQDKAQAIAFHNDGNIMLVGRSINAGNLNFAVLRLNCDGTIKKSGDLDVCFGTSPP